jgi:hypothetical protein
MVVGGWSGTVATAVGVGAAAGAAQLGFGYGLNIISWLPASDGLSGQTWVASLAWATWIAATSATVGAIVADRLSTAPARTAVTATAPAPGPADRVTTGLWRLTLAVAAALGALVTVALIAVPARTAVRADNFLPQATAAGYAILGIVVGLVLAVAALTSRAAAANALATVAWLWLLALVAVVDAVASGRSLAPLPLAVWEFTTSGWRYKDFHLPTAGFTLAAAFVIGALAALPAARRGDNRVGVVMSGVIGPLTVAAAYLLAQPSLVGTPPVQISPHLVAPYAVLAGLAGSLLASLVRPRPVADAAAPVIAAGRAAVAPEPPAARRGTDAALPTPATDASRT